MNETYQQQSKMFYWKWLRYRLIIMPHASCPHWKPHLGVYAMSSFHIYYTKHVITIQNANESKKKKFIWILETLSVYGHFIDIRECVCECVCRHKPFALLQFDILQFPIWLVCLVGRSVGWLVLCLFICLHLFRWNGCCFSFFSLFSVELLLFLWVLF